jgi:YHS domain-containing protein
VRNWTLWMMIVVLACGLAGVGCQQQAQQEQETEAVTEEVEPAVELVDPVCGVTVTAETEFTMEYEGVTYYFCCEDCMQQFVADPAKYLMTEMEPEAETEG